jgi:predicted RNA binding protein YcfA (HicA-like mRNA interferase family)
MPPKIRELIAELEEAGFVNSGGRGSHRNFIHSRCRKPVTISGKPGDDGKHYQVRAVRLALEELKKK